VPAHFHCPPTLKIQHGGPHPEVVVSLIEGTMCRVKRAFARRDREVKIGVSLWNRGAAITPVNAARASWTCRRDFNVLNNAGW
jgi:hypothetical protein